MFLSKKIIYLSLFAIIILVIAISSLTLFSQSIRLDESQSIWQSTKPLSSIIGIIGQDVHVPLYAFILHFWLQIFGTSIVTARILSLIFLIATIPVLYQLYKEASNEKIALISVLAFSLSPFVVWYSNETRMYTLFIFVSTINSLYFLRFVRSEGKEGKLGYFISTIFGFYTHYFYVFLLATQILFIVGNTVLRGIKRRDFRRTSLQGFVKYKRMFFIYFGILIGAGIFFLPWVIFFISSGAAVNDQPLIPPPTTFNIFETFTNFIFGFQSNSIQAAIISLWPLVVMVFFFIFTQRPKKNARNIEYFVLAAFLPIFMVYVASFIKPIFLSRYLIFTIPPLFFLIIWLFMGYTKKLSSVLVVLFLAVLFVLMLFQNISANTPVKEDYHAVTAYLNQHAAPSDIIVVTPPFTIYPVEYYYTGYAGLSSIPEWDRYTYGPVPPFLLPVFQKQLATYKTEYTNIYIVFSYDQGYEGKIKTYMDSHYKRLKDMKFSPGLELREYRLRYDIKL